MSQKLERPLALIILDGWGVSSNRSGNAIAAAHTPYYNHLRTNFPGAVLEASGRFVGLAEGEPGNAETGHRTIGAGRVVPTVAARVQSASMDGTLRDNQQMRAAFSTAAGRGAAVHFIGLIGDAGIHSSQEALFALLRSAKASGVREAFIHGILDGRDVRPRSADIYVEALEIKMADIGIGRIASLCGRFYGMDSSGNWERTARAYTMLVHGEGERGSDAVTAIRGSFLRGISDEFIAPVVIENEPNKPMAVIRDGDLVVFFNHTAEPMRQLVRSLAVPDAAASKPKVDTICLTEYDPTFGLPVIFAPANETSVLSDIFDEHGIMNYRITESGRAEHISSFFNSRSAAPGEFERQLILKAAGPESLDSEPESKSFKIADGVRQGLESGAPVVVANLPSPGLLAEAGNFEKAVEAVQFVDTCLGGILETVADLNGIAVITSSHPGCEEIDQPGRFANPVPFYVVDSERPELKLSVRGSLQDVAPTVLGLLGLECPPEMTGRDLRV